MRPIFTIRTCKSPVYFTSRSSMDSSRPIVVAYHNYKDAKAMLVLMNEYSIHKLQVECTSFESLSKKCALGMLDLCVYYDMDTTVIHKHVQEPNDIIINNLEHIINK